MKTIPELLDAYDRGIIPRALLIENLFCWIPKKSIDEIFESLPGRELRIQFAMSLIATAEPGYVNIDGTLDREELLVAVREYVRLKLSGSSANWDFPGNKPGNKPGNP